MAYCLLAFLIFFFLMIRCPPISTLFPYTTLFRSVFRQYRFSPHPSPKLANSELQPRALPQGASAVSEREDRKSTRLNSSHVRISYAVFCLKKKKTYRRDHTRSRAVAGLLFRPKAS